MNYKCSRCSNTEHPRDAKYCGICGLKISRLVAAGTTTDTDLLVDQVIEELGNRMKEVNRPS